MAFPGSLRFLLPLLFATFLPCVRSTSAQTASDPNPMQAINSAMRSRNFEQALQLAPDDREARYNLDQILAIQRQSAGHSD